MCVTVMTVTVTDVCDSVDSECALFVTVVTVTVCDVYDSGDSDSVRCV